MLKPLAIAAIAGILFSITLRFAYHATKHELMN
jgi:hypothetical protein